MICFSIKATHQEALGFICFTASSLFLTDISISVLYFIISVSCFVFLLDFFENACLGGGVLARFFCPRGLGFALSLCSGGGEFALPKQSPGVCPGKKSGLELTDTLLSKSMYHVYYFKKYIHNFAE